MKKSLIFIGAGVVIFLPFLLLFLIRKRNLLKEKTNAGKIINDLFKKDRESINKANNSFTVILENHGKEDPLLPEPGHGISLYLERDGKKYLLDTGTGEIISKNAEKLGIDLKDIDIVFVSHGHYDHGGGLLPFLKRNKKATVYLSTESLVDKHYAKIAGIINKDISIDSSLLRDYPERIVFVKEFTEISKDVFIIPFIDKKLPVPKTNSNLFKQVKGKGAIFKDDFNHEQLLVIKEKEGLIVYSGCCHSGVLNVIDTVKDFFPEERIRAIIGGFHLINPVLLNLGEDRETVIKLGNDMLKEGVDKYITGHCTGVEGYLTLKEVLGEKTDYFYCGKEFTL